MPKIAVIGSGFAGMAAATTLAEQGHEVTVYEKNDQPGGRARVFEHDGFRFDMGPSWYWMPDVFEDYFNRFGKKVSDYYHLERLDPSYRVYFEDGPVDIPANYEEMKALFESIEPGSAAHLDTFMKEAGVKYDIGMSKFVFKPSHNVFEFAELNIARDAMKLHLFKSFSSYIRKYFKNPKLLQLLEFPVLFLGAKPEKTPALYSLMNYADTKLGTWYPMGGMNEIVKGMVALAEEKGVKFEYNAAVTGIEKQGKDIRAVVVNGKAKRCDAVVAATDYHHFDQQVLPPESRNYDEKYWDKRTMSPSSLLYYLAIDKKVDGLKHHNLFFDEDFGKHAVEIYDTKEWPERPLFYACVPSKTDPAVAPTGKENVFILIPVAPGMQEEKDTREHYFNLVMDRLEQHLGEDLRPHITYNRSYAHKEFINDYNAYKGNAYGLANTLDQTAFLKPKLRSKKLTNLYYAGQLTTPGPGVPPSLISGQVAADELNKTLKKKVEVAV
jgi:phytoene desaturase